MNFSLSSEFLTPKRRAQLNNVQTRKKENVQVDDECVWNPSAKNAMKISFEEMKFKNFWVDFP